MPQRVDPEGRHLPIKLDSTSNGELMPIPLEDVNRHANHLAQTWASENAKRRVVSRRSFMISACGAASTLLAFNAAHRAAGQTGGSFELEQAATVDPDLALEQQGGREFIFDVQGHFVGQVPSPSDALPCDTDADRTDRDAALSHNVTAISLRSSWTAFM